MFHAPAIAPRSRSAAGRRALVLVLLAGGLLRCGRDAPEAGDRSSSPEPAAAGAAAPPDAEPGAVPDEEELTLPPPGDPEKARPLIQQARGQINEGKWPEAMALLDQAVAQDPTSGEAYTLRGLLYMSDGPLKDLGLALRNIRMARLTRPGSVELMGSEASVRDQLGQTRPTIDLLEEIVARSEGVPALAAQRLVALGTLGKLLLREENLDEAERHLLAAEASGQADPQVALSLAHLAAARGRPAEHERWLEESLSRDPLLLVARRERQTLLVRQGREEEALREREVVEQLRLLAQDNSTRLKRDVEAQAALWGRLAGLLPDVPRCRVEQVRLYGRNELWDQALAAGLPALEAGLRHPDVIVYVALAQGAKGQLEEALATAGLLKECQPPAPDEMLFGLRNRVRTMQGDGDR